MMTRRCSDSLLVAFPLAALLGLSGCSSVTATEVENTLGSNGNAADHMAAAMRYQSIAQELAAEAERYEATALKIGPYEDPKGIRRGGLMTAAQEKRGAARRMEGLYAVHFEKAHTIYGLTKPE